jgi:hypothetical protein
MPVPHIRQLPLTNKPKLLDQVRTVMLTRNLYKEPLSALSGRRKSLNPPPAISCATHLPLIYWRTVRTSGRSGVARSQGPEHDDDLYARAQSRRQGSTKSVR